MASGRSRGWCFTLNNYTDAEETALQHIQFAYLIYGREVGLNGTPHLQGYIHFTNAKKFTQIKAMLGLRYHLERRKGTLEQAITYCKKDGDYLEFGRKPMSGKEKGQAEKDRWGTILSMAKAGDITGLQREYPKEAILHGPRLLALHEPNTQPIDGPLSHEWWVGPTGTGKSRLVWELYPQHFAKTLNKWWDGYKFQDVVVIEEWAPRNECTASFLKVWADRYAFSAEVKGAILPMIRPKKLIVLSNYTIEQCFPQKEDCDPLLRRFTVINFPGSKFHAQARVHNYLQQPIPTPPPNEQPPVQDPSLESNYSDSDGYVSDGEIVSSFLNDFEWGGLSPIAESL